jgi:hypothetical protein
MEHRNTALARLSLAVALLFATAAFAPADAPPTPVHELASSRQEGPVTLRWVFRENDLLSCRSAAAEVRRLRREFGAHLHVVAVAVDVDHPLVESFMRKERLFDLNVSYVNEGEYRRAYGGEVTPSLVMVRAGRVVEVFAAGGMPVLGRRPLAAISPTLRGFFAVALAPNHRVSEP